MAAVVEGITVVGNVQVTSISEPLGDESLIEESDFWEAFDGPPTVAMEVTVQMFLTPDEIGQARLRVVAERLHRLAAEMSGSGGGARVIGGAFRRALGAGDPHRSVHSPTAKRPDRRFADSGVVERRARTKDLSSVRAGFLTSSMSRGIYRSRRAKRHNVWRLVVLFKP